MRRRLHAGFVLGFAVLMQAALTDEFAVFGLTPEFALVCVYIFGLKTDEVRGTLYGVAAGLAIDCLSGGLLGLAASGYALVGYFAGRLTRFFFDMGPTANFVGLFSLSLGYGAYCAITLETLIGGYSLPETLLYYALGQSFYNAFVGLFVMWATHDNTLRRFRRLDTLRHVELVF